MIDFIIPIRDRENDRLKNCINSIKGKSVGRIIVVDYGSRLPIKTDAEIIKVNRNYYPVWNKSHALNIGIRASRAKYIATIDCDIVLPKGFVDRARKELDKNKFVLSNKVRRIARFTTFEQSLARSTDWIPGRPDYQKAVGGIQLFSRDWANKYRGYNEELTNWGGIDTYMYELAVASGLEMAFIDDIILHQEHARKKEDNLPPGERHKARMDRAGRKTKVTTLVQEAIQLERWGVFDDMHGSPKISCAIMAHPKRRKQANVLYSQLKKYPFTDCQIIWDTINDRWDTGERALRAGIGLAAGWHVVIQDDAILAPNFYDHLTRALRAAPVKSLISLYTGTARPLPRRVGAAVAKAGKNCSWLRYNVLMWGVGIVMPTWHIKEVIDFVSDRTEAYDFRIGWAYQRNRLPIFYTNPSLVDHDDDLGSLLNHGQSPEPRRARNFIGDKSVTWNDRVLDI